MRIVKPAYLFAFILGVIFNFSVCAQEVQLTIIGNSKSVPTVMDMKQLKSVLRGEKLRWEDGSTIKIALMKTNTSVGAETCEKIYNMTDNELNRYFLALVFQGKVKAPTFFDTEDELEKYVARTPGAIGVSQNTTGENLKIIVVDGKNQI